VSNKNHYGPRLLVNASALMIKNCAGSIKVAYRMDEGDIFMTSWAKNGLQGPENQQMSREFFCISCCVVLKNQNLNLNNHQSLKLKDF